MLRIALATWIVFGVSLASAQDKSTVALHEFVESASLPEGLTAKTSELKDGDKLLGYLITLTNPNQISKVLVRIDLTDRPTVPMRRAAVKAWVNVFVEALNNQGYSVVDKTNVPDLAKETFDKPVSIGLVLENDDKKKLWMHQEIFFTDKTFAAQVLADDAATFAKLVTWAKTVKPKGK